MGKRYSLSELGEFLGGIVLNNADVFVEDVVSSGNHSVANSLFVAYKGVQVDGHRFIDQAFENGSVAALVTDKEKLNGKPGILVENSKLSLSKLCALFNDFPSKQLITVGVTGTNGKTTIHYLLSNAFDKLNLKSLRIGSLGIEGNDIHHSGKVNTKAGQIFMTTPDAYEIQKALGEAVNKGFKSVVIETSSHALTQYRVSDVYYDIGIFTNLTPEHLNYHKDMEDYFNAKLKLFEKIANENNKKSLKVAIVNKSCEYGLRLLEICKKLNLNIYSYGYDENSTVKIVEFKQNFVKSVLTLEFKEKKYEITTNLIGNYNGENIAACFSALIACGIEPEKAAIAMCDLPTVPGRLESFSTDKMGIYVDYAHTGDGLENVLSALKPFAKNNLWVVFGCGGGKDPGKRIAMGNAAKKYADKIVLTNDNPKLEDSEKIVADILKSGCHPEFIEYDRGKAIFKALSSGKPGDVFVLAGKGHEDYQIIGKETIPYSDQEEIKKWKGKNR